MPINACCVFFLTQVSHESATTPSAASLLL
jgi:hypothetical protein